MQKVADESD
jgi:hypothetical protein